MKLFIILTSIIALASTANIAYIATPVLRSAAAYPYSYSAHSSSLITPNQQQYHTQDEFGQYAYGYSEPLSSKQEVRSLDGITRGSYSYRDAAGKLQTVDYTADADGFRVAATNLPRPVPLPEFRPQEAPTPVADSAAVTAARQAHLAAHQEAKLRLAKINAANTIDNQFTNSIDQRDSNAIDISNRRMELPQPVDDTPEVAAAKADHLNRFEQEKFRNQILQSERKIIAAPAAVYRATTIPIAYQSAVAPRIYGYSYPFNGRFLATNFYY